MKLRIELFKTFGMFDHRRGLTQNGTFENRADKGFQNTEKKIMVH